jgi:hypothetical protein
MLGTLEAPDSGSYTSCTDRTRLADSGPSCVTYASSPGITVLAGIGKAGWGPARAWGSIYAFQKAVGTDSREFWAQGKAM